MGIYDEKFTIETTADRVYRRFDNRQVDEKLKSWANQQLRKIQPDLDQALQFDDGYQDFLLEYLSAEVEQFSEGERTDPICTCDDIGCPLKDGCLPHMVLEAESMDDGIKRFKQTHRGTPQVLIDGRKQWRETRRNCWFVLRHIETHMTEERTEIPEDPTPQIDERERAALPGD